MSNHQPNQRHERVCRLFRNPTGNLSKTISRRVRLIATSLSYTPVGRDRHSVLSKVGGMRGRRGKASSHLQGLLGEVDVLYGEQARTETRHRLVVHDGGAGGREHVRQVRQRARRQQHQVGVVLRVQQPHQRGHKRVHRKRRQGLLRGNRQQLALRAAAREGREGHSEARTQGYPGEGRDIKPTPQLNILMYTENLAYVPPYILNVGRTETCEGEGCVRGSVNHTLDGSETSARDEVMA